MNLGDDRNFGHKFMAIFLSVNLLGFMMDRDEKYQNSHLANVFPVMKESNASLAMKNVCKICNL